MTRCPVCHLLHKGSFSICAVCLKTARTEQNSQHHPDCPASWHDQAACRCPAIRGQQYE